VVGGLVAWHAGVSAGRDVISSSRHSDVLGVVVLGVFRGKARGASSAIIEILSHHIEARKSFHERYVRRLWFMRCDG
jgi:hypothetical protein